MLFIVIKKLRNSPIVSRVLINASWLLFDYFLRFILGYFITIWLARKLGPEYYGIFNFALAIQTILMAIGSAGLIGTATKAIIQNRGNEGQVLATVFNLRLLASSICYILILVFLTSYNISGDKLYLTLIICGSLFLNGFRVLDLYFEAHLKVKDKVLSRSLAYLFRSFLLLVLIIGDLNILYLGVIILLEESIGTSLLLFFYKKNSNKSFFKFGFSNQMAKKLLKESWPLIFSSIGGLIYLRIDQIMVVNMIGEAEGGYYAAAVRITELFYFIPTLIMTSIFPILLENKESNIPKYERQLQKLIISFLVIGIIIIVLVFIFDHMIIALTFGEDYLSAVPIIRVHIWTLIFSFIDQILNKWLILEQLTFFSLVRTQIGAFTNVILNILLIPSFGGVGAAIASVVSLFMAVIGFLILNKKTRKFYKLIAKSVFINFTSMK